MEPLELSPTYVSPIWGGTRIAEIRGIPHTARDNHGEAFDVSAHPTTCTTIAAGPHAGERLDSFLSEHHDEVLGNIPENNILQVTFMAPIANLSVQVHPGEEYARRTCNDHGKAESWYILEAVPGATLIGGSTTTDVPTLRAAAADDTIGDAYGKRFEVQEGDFVYVRPGTMHALGPGILAVEVGSFGNTTLRICDWGRGRRLDVERAFDVLRPEQEVSIRHLGPYRTVRQQVRRGVEAEGFTVDVLDICGSRDITMEGRYQVLTCVKGTATVETAKGAIGLSYTRSLVMPASLGTYAVHGDCRMLLSQRYI